MSLNDSRYVFSNRFRFPDGEIFFEERNFLRFSERLDNRLYTIKAGDNLFNIAHRFFRTFERGAGLWWVIMDFNNIFDPSQDLEPGRTLIIPSEDFVRGRIASRDFNTEIQTV